MEFGGMRIVWDRVFGTLLDGKSYALDAGEEGALRSLRAQRRTSATRSW